MPAISLTRRHVLKAAAIMATGLPAAAATTSISPKEIIKLLTPCPDGQRRWRVTGRECPALDSFDKLIRQFMTARHATGAALAVTRRSRLVYARGYNWSRPDAPAIQPETPFRIASLSKAITSAGVMWLVQQGKLRLSDKLLDLVPMTPLPGDKSDPRLGKITLLHLLRHQGGWDRGRSFDPMFRDRTITKRQGVALPIGTANIIQYMAGIPLDFDPGARMAYSNFGYCLLGRVIEKVTGQPYGAFMRETILRKIGIEAMALGATAFTGRRTDEPFYFTKDLRLQPSVVVPGMLAPNPYGAWNLENMDAHGGWLASAVDLARFMPAFDVTGGYPLLEKKSIDEIFAKPPTGPDQSGAHYGCGWNVRPAGSSINTWHTGSLPGTFTLMVRRNDGLNWVVLFNQRDDPSGLSYAPIDGLLHQAANAVKSWPEDNLF